MEQLLAQDAEPERAPPRRRPGVAIVAAVALVAAVAGAVVSRWNPSNFLYLETLGNPFLEALIIGGLIIVLLWTSSTNEAVRVYGTTLVAVPTLLLLGLWILIGGVPRDDRWHTDAENPANDVKVVFQVTNVYDDVYNYSLQADRGLASRREFIVSKAELEAPSRFLDSTTVSFDLGGTDLIVEFDPHTLEVLGSECIDRQTPNEPASYCPRP